MGVTRNGKRSGGREEHPKPPREQSRTLKGKKRRKTRARKEKLYNETQKRSLKNKKVASKRKKTRRESTDKGCRENDCHTSFTQRKRDPREGIGPKDERAKGKGGGTDP